MEGVFNYTPQAIFIIGLIMIGYWQYSRITEVAPPKRPAPKGFEGVPRSFEDFKGMKFDDVEVDPLAEKKKALNKARRRKDRNSDSEDE